jgi:iron complex transport system substrate-binding protein
MKPIHSLISLLLLLTLLAASVAPVAGPATEANPTAAATVVPQETTPVTANAATTIAADADCEAGFRLFDHEGLATVPVCVPIAPERIIALDMASVGATLLTPKTLVATSGWILSELPLLSLSE